MTRAVRVRKARRWSPCALCPVLICTGNLVGKLPDGRWAHAACIIASQTSAASTAAAEPSTEESA